jgi:uncharacterized membrane protein YqaE (UPF0057 family)
MTQLSIPNLSFYVLENAVFLGIGFGSWKVILHMLLPVLSEICII